MGVLVLVVVEYAIGMYVNLYASIPGADHGAGIGSAISNGPATLSVHAVLGLLLAIAALGVLVQAIMSRLWFVTASSVVGLVALAFASVTGTSLTSTGDTSDSMAMSVMTGVALLCYALNIFIVRPRPGA
jgi:hypothetical protein